MWVVPRDQLTEDQLAAVLMSTGKHRVVIGGPGSGKTLVLAHRAQQLLSAGTPQDRLQLLVYTNVLAQYLDEGLGQLGLPEESAATFDSWCLKLFDRIVRGKRPRDPADPKGLRIDFDAIRAAVLDKVTREAVPPLLDVVLVDEGQDLTPTAVQLLAAVSVHVTLALDSRQQLYDTGMDAATACQILGVPRAAASLLSAYRCTPLIVDMAAQFLPTDTEAAAFRSANLLPLDGVETPVLFTATGPEHEMDELAVLIGERAMLGHTTAVLVPTRREEYKVAKALSERNVHVATRKDLSFGDLRPIVLTYHSAKGLTVDAVFLPALTESAFVSVPESDKRARMLFVGVTRATRWAWLGTRSEGRLAELDRVAPLIRRDTLRELPNDQFTSSSTASGPGRATAPGPAVPAAPAKKRATPAPKRPAPAANIADLL